MPDPCDPIRAELAAVEEELAHTEEFETPEAGEIHPPKPFRNPEWRRLSERRQKLERDLAACEGPPAPSMITDIRLEENEVVIEATVLTTKARDFILDFPPRRKPTSHSMRRALVHGFDDELVLNWDGDYPGG